MRRVVLSGWAKGQPVRQARKEGRCGYWMGAGHCSEIIRAGDTYVEGEANIAKAGGYGRDRWCLAHFDAGDLGG